MIDFIIKYWLEIAFGLIVTVLSYFVRRFYKLWKDEKDAQSNSVLNQLKEELKTYNQTMLEQKEALLNAEDIKLQRAIKEVEESNTKLLNAVLEVQKKQFRIDCKQLLESNEYITFEQFENLCAEHSIYQSLGGNGMGDTLFDLVAEKYATQMMAKDSTEYVLQKFDIPLKQKHSDIIQHNPNVVQHTAPLFFQRPSDPSKEAKG